MTPRSALWASGVCAAALVGLIALGILGIMTGSNCGGNSAAMSAVRVYLMVAQQFAGRSPSHQFDLTNLTVDEREELTDIAHDFWLEPARFLISREPYREPPSTPSRLLIVCDHPYNNVPKWLPPWASATHAAGFSDGSVRLISTAEFAALDRSKFVPLDEVLARAERSTPP